MKILMFTLSLIVIVAGCTKNDEQHESIKMLQGTIQKLTDTNDKLELALEQSQTKSNEYINENNKLQELNDQLEAEWEDLTKEISETESLSRIIEGNRCIYDVSKEGIYINEVLINPEDLSEEVIIDLLGKPLHKEEYVVYVLRVSLDYDNFNITFHNFAEGQEVGYISINGNGSNIVTQGGITVGSTKNQVIEAYGEGYWAHSEEYVGYGSEKTGIDFYFSLEDGYVTEIKIRYSYEGNPISF
jgi:cell division protein FtsB